MDIKKKEKYYFRINENDFIENDNNCNVGNTQQKRFLLPNQLISTPTVSVGEFTTTEEARSFPFPNRWCVQWSDQRMNEYKRQGIRVLIICDWERQNDDQFKYVLATVKPNHLIYWDFDDVRFDNSPNALQEYEGGLGQDVVEFIHNISNTSTYNNQENLKTENKTMKKTKNVMRLTESQLHRVIKESVNRILREGGLSPYGGLNDIDITKFNSDLSYIKDALGLIIYKIERSNSQSFTKAINCRALMQAIDNVEQEINEYFDVIIR